MSRRPEGETRKERRLQRIIGTGVVVLFLLLGVIVIQGIVQYRSQENHHASSTQQQAEILGLLHTVREAQVTNKGTIAEIASLQKQVAGVIAGLPAADTELTAFAKQILEVEQYAVTCLTTQNCANPPTISTTSP